tara:strand:- start:281 stop:898 length:618 start_codon:yes stop_codon:yes gene_type:complete
MYIHLPILKEVSEEDEITLSMILEHFKPLEVLDLNFFLNHTSCRFTEEDDLTRQISNVKELNEKECFIKKFPIKNRAGIRKALEDYNTIFDYYRHLTSKKKVNEYFNILINFGEGSNELYNFITEKLNKRKTEAEKRHLDRFRTKEMGKSKVAKANPALKSDSVTQMQGKLTPDKVKVLSRNQTNSKESKLTPDVIALLKEIGKK